MFAQPCVIQATHRRTFSSRRPLQKLLDIREDEFLLRYVMTERKSTDKLQDAAERLAWEIVSTSIRLDELRSIWAKMIGITGPQWMIMTVLANAEDRSVGLPVGAVSRALRVDQSFVVTQSKLLEKKNLVRRKSSTEDARVVNLSLTEHAKKQMANLSAQRKELNEFVYADLDLRELLQLTGKMDSIKSRLEKAIARISVDL
ncbi:MarR family winged helix-turn-helix transcriptional regulator [Bradyrhizobium quebecense]|uniref:MarR family transcriptional regulator n=3 Tax=Bradyrhizobium quebecense TaxID=2748629 RepID=A0ABS3ME63_9BRAD|nr:MarR family transcriptional regulator [Bradyrhizobium quebecense]UGY05050.1 MarR family transcriptional regulator [Bradyrhizobium quebecense]